jgi:hypothetical protein
MVNEIDLDNYENVSKKDWGHIPLRTYIRYEKQNGTITRGGFLKSVCKPVDQPDEFKLVLTNDLFNNPNPITWEIYSTNVKNIWKKISKDILIASIDDEQKTTFRQEMSLIKEELATTRKNYNELEKNMRLCLTFIKKITEEQKFIKEKQNSITRILEILSKKINGP